MRDISLKVNNNSNLFLSLHLFNTIYYGKTRFFFFRSSISNSVNLSCVVQRVWILVSNICHGLLAGLALAHILFIITTKPVDWVEGSIKHYSSFAEVYSNTFYCLAIVCLVSIFDRYVKNEIWKYSVSTNGCNVHKSFLNAKLLFIYYNFFFNN